MRIVWDGENRHHDEDWQATYEFVELDDDLSEAEAIAELNAIKPHGMGDNCHLEADAVILSFVPAAVLDAYWAVNARERGFHYS